MAPGLIRHVPSAWQDAVVVCGKCSRKIGGGFGPKGKQPLAKALRKALKLGKGRKSPVGVVESRCLGVCPKRAVTVARAGEWLVVPAGTSIAQVALELGLAGPRALGDRKSG